MSNFKVTVSYAKSANDTIHISAPSETEARKNVVSMLSPEVQILEVVEVDEDWTNPTIVTRCPKCRFKL